MSVRAEWLLTMDKRYFYLDNTHSKPKGPHSLQELSGMLLRGKLQPTTEVAAGGDERWLPLGTLLMQAPVPAELPQVPGLAETGNCPKCGRQLSCEEGALPVNCPSCGYRLRAAQDTMWQHIQMALSRPFTWRGRSTRKEFWSTLLLYLLLSIPASIVALVLFSICTAITLQEHNDKLDVATWLSAESMLPAWIAVAVLTALFLYFSLVFLSLTIRRLHDIGCSGRWVALSMLVSAIWQYFYYSRAAEIVAAVNWKMLLAIEDDRLRQARIQEIADQINLVGTEGWGGLFYLLSMVVGIVIFIFALTDSNRGANAYGPSAKYPQG